MTTDEFIKKLREELPKDAEIEFAEISALAKNSESINLYTTEDGKTLYRNKL